MSEARKLFTFERCCCFTLETGGLISGSIIMLIDTLVLIGIINKMSKFWDAPCQDFFLDKEFRDFTSNIYVDECEAVKTASLGLEIFRLASFSIELITMILFIIGIMTRNHKLIVPAIVAEIVLHVFSIITEIIAFSKIRFILMILGTILSVFLILLMFSLYLKFRDERIEYTQAKYTRESKPDA